MKQYFLKKYSYKKIETFKSFGHMENKKSSIPLFGLNITTMHLYVISIYNFLINQNKILMNCQVQAEIFAILFTVCAF